MSHENKLREGLFSAEPLSPERQQRFREEIVQIMEPRLPRSHRLYYSIGLIGSVAGIFGAVCALVFDAEHRWCSALMLLLWTACAAWLLHILRRGAEPLRIMQAASKVFSGMSGFVAGLLIFYGIQNPSVSNILWALLGLLAFQFMSMINLWNRVITVERNVREQILRVEYRLAD
jgi:hypothetical protein